MTPSGSIRRTPAIAAALVFISILSAVGVSQAFVIGNSKIGGFSVPCAVACGGKRGIVNFNFAGDAFHSLVTQPSIDDLRDKFRGLGKEFLAEADARLNATLDKKLKELDTLATAQQDRFFDELGSSSKAALTDLDNVLRDIVRSTQAQTEAQLQKTNISLNTALVLTAAIATTLGVLAIALFKFVAHTPMKTALVRSLVVALVIFAIGGAASWGYERWQVAATKRSYRTELTNAAQLGDLYRAAYFATRLSEFDPFDDDASAEAAAAQIFRDLHHRPTIYRQAKEGESTLLRILTLQSRLVARQNRRNADLDAVIAMLLWQMGDDRYAEYLAARFAAAALSNPESNAANYGAKALAYYYLTLFLQSLPVDNDLRSIAHQRESGVPDFAGSPIEPPPATVAVMRSIAEKSHAALADGYPRTRESLGLNSVNLQSLDLYSRMILAHARAVGASTAEARARYDNLRNQLALRLEATWMATLQNIGKEPSASTLIMTADTFHQSLARATAIKLAPPYLYVNSSIGVFENADWHDEMEIPGFGKTRVSKLSELRVAPKSPPGTLPGIAPPTPDAAKQFRCIEVATAGIAAGIPVAIAGVTPVEGLRDAGRASMSPSTARRFEQSVRISSYRLQQKLRLLESNLVLSELPPNLPIPRCSSNEARPPGKPFPAPTVTPQTEGERESRRAGILFLAADLGLLICAEKAETESPCSVDDHLTPLSGYLKDRYDKSSVRYATSNQLSEALDNARKKRANLRL